MTVRRVVPVAALLLVGGCGAFEAEVPTAEVGECLQQEFLAGDEVDEIPVLDCSEEHDSQVVGVFDAREGDYPGEEEWTQIVTDGCLPAFEEFVGVDYGDSELRVSQLTPAEDLWDDGDREVLCLAYLDGETTTESFEGSGL